MTSIDTPEFTQMLRMATDDAAELIDRRIARRQLFTSLSGAAVEGLLADASLGDKVLGAVAGAVGGSEGDEVTTAHWIACLRLVIEAICEGAKEAVGGDGLKALLKGLAPKLEDSEVGAAVAQSVVDIVRIIKFEGATHPLINALASTDRDGSDGVFRLLDADAGVGSSAAHDFREWSTGEKPPVVADPLSVMSILANSSILLSAVESLETGLGEAVRGDGDCDVLLLSANLHVLGPLGQHQPLPPSLIALMMQVVVVASGMDGVGSTMEVEVVLPTVLRSLSQLLRNPTNASALLEGIPNVSAILQHALGDETNLGPDAREVLLDVVASMAASEALCAPAVLVMETTLPSVFTRRGATFGEVASGLMVVAHYAGATHRYAPGGKAEVKSVSTGGAVITPKYFNDLIWPRRTHHEVSVRRATWHAVDALVQNPITRGLALGSASMFFTNYATHAPAGDEPDVRAAQMSCMTSLLRCPEAAAFHTKIAAQKARGMYPKGNEGAMQMAEETYQR